MIIIFSAERSTLKGRQRQRGTVLRPCRIIAQAFTQQACDNHRQHYKTIFDTTHCWKNSIQNAIPSLFPVLWFWPLHKVDSLCKHLFWPSVSGLICCCGHWVWKEVPPYCPQHEQVSECKACRVSDGNSVVFYSISRKNAFKLSSTLTITWHVFTEKILRRAV